MVLVFGKSSHYTGNCIIKLNIRPDTGELLTFMLKSMMDNVTNTYITF